MIESVTKILSMSVLVMLIYEFFFPLNPLSYKLYIYIYLLLIKN